MGAQSSSSSHAPADLEEHLSVHREYLDNIRQRIDDHDDMEGIRSALRRVEKSGSGRRPPKPVPLRLLGVALDARFHRLAQVEDVNDAIWVFRRAVEVGIKDSEQQIWLHDLGKALRRRFERLREPQDIHESVSVLRRTVEITPDWYPDRLAHLSSLGNSLHVRFVSLQEPQDLEDAIVIYRRVIELTPEGYTDKLAGFHSLATLLQKRFQTSGELTDLEEAIALQRRAAKLPDGHPSKPAQLSSLGNSLHARFQRLNDPSDIEEAILVLRRAVDLTPDKHPDRLDWLQTLATSLYSHSQRPGELGDLEEAIALMRQTTRLTSDVHPAKADRCHLLGVSLHQRFRQLGELSDLEEAIIAQRHGIKCVLEGYTLDPNWFNSLGRSLQSRFRRLGEPGDLDEAISMHRRAVLLTPDGRLDKAAQLNNLGTILSIRVERCGELDDLDEAISLVRRAVDLTPIEHPNRPTMLSNLGVMLRERFVRIKEREDLDESISVLRKAVNFATDGDSLPAPWFNNLANSLRKRSEQVAGLVDLDEAITSYHRAIDLTPAGHPDQTTWFMNLGWAWRERLRRSKKPEDFHSSVSCFMEAATHTQSIPSSRLDAAEDCIALLTANPKYSSQELLLTAHSCIFDIIPEIVWLGHGMQRRYTESSQIAKFINAAAAAAIAANALTQAVEWLEAGRALVWSQILSLRTPLDDLQASHPRLADSLRGIQQELRYSIPVSSQESKSFDRVADIGTDSSTADRHRGLAIQYDSIMKEIRSCPGFESFLRPKPFESLALPSQPDRGSVIFINVHATRCDALILAPGGDVTSVSLPDLSTDRAIKLRALWTQQLRSCGVRMRAVVHGSGSGDSTYLVRVLKLTWDWIAHPILQFLNVVTNISSDKSLPHITWCPTGPVAQIPLHAAGIYTDPLGPRIFNLVVSSYTPSLSALHRIYEGATQHHESPGVLIVTQPATPRHSPLPGTKAEGLRLEEILSKAKVTKELLNHEQATIASVSRYMSKCSWAHLACHGIQHPEDAIQSAFALYDGPLTLSTLMTTVAEDAELAFLSACQTATGDEANPEESVHLAAGMLAVGFKGVVATMWSIGDQEAPIVVEAYYERLLELRSAAMFAGGPMTGAAYALHEALKVLRERVGESNFVKWAPFVHFGA